jgi:NADH-quinone oxidoreductase subunit M
MTGWLWAMLALPWLAALALVMIGHRWRSLPQALPLVGVFCLCGLLAVGRYVGGGTDAAPERGAWLRLDAIALPFVINLLLVSLGAVCYALGYWRPGRAAHLRAALMLIFIGSMLGTLISSHMVLFLVFWEGMLLSSCLLMAGWGDGPRIGPITLQYFLVTQAASFLLLVGVAWSLTQTGEASRVGLPARLAHTALGHRQWIAAIMFVGFGIKLAIAPLHVWLPDAHSIAPMPVTILLAGAMLSMGAYGMLRFPVAILGAEGMSWAQGPLMALALASQIYGAVLCMAATDVKRLVAYSSVSQMGYVLFGIATLTTEGMAGGIMHVINHGILKALLFMAVGLMMQATGRRQIGQLGGLYATLPVASCALWVGAIALTDVPPFCAFHSERLILTAGLVSAFPWAGYLAFAAPLFTTAYAMRLAARGTLGQAKPDLQIGATALAMRLATAAFALLALIAGLFPAPLYRWAFAASAQLTQTGGW